MKEDSAACERYIRCCSTTKYNKARNYHIIMEMLMINPQTECLVTFFHQNVENVKTGTIVKNFTEGWLDRNNY